MKQRIMVILLIAGAGFFLCYGRALPQGTGEIQVKSQTEASQTIPDKAEEERRLRAEQVIMIGNIENRLQMIRSEPNFVLPNLEGQDFLQEDTDLGEDLPEDDDLDLTLDSLEQVEQGTKPSADPSDKR